MMKKGRKKMRKEMNLVFICWLDLLLAVTEAMERLIGKAGTADRMERVARPTTSRGVS